MKVVVTQSNYIPWKGYFDQINNADVWVVYDDMQYTRRDWRNRNKIKTAQGLQWLTVPVEVKGKYFQKIKETRVSDSSWAEKHWKSIAFSYAKAPSMTEYGAQIQELYATVSSDWLTEINLHFMKGIMNLLNITTDIRLSSEFDLAEDRNERLLNICKALNATHYISGPAAKDYLDADMFAAAGIEVEWADYSGYREYRQLHGGFEHGVSIVDLLLNEGSNSPKYLKSL